MTRGWLRNVYGLQKSKPDYQVFKKDGKINYQTSTHFFLDTSSRKGGTSKEVHGNTDLSTCQSWVGVLWCGHCSVSFNLWYSASFGWLHSSVHPNNIFILAPHLNSCSAFSWFPSSPISDPAIKLIRNFFRNIIYLRNWYTDIYRSNWEKEKSIHTFSTKR